MRNDEFQRESDNTFNSNIIKESLLYFNYSFSKVQVLDIASYSNETEE